MRKIKNNIKFYKKIISISFAVFGVFLIVFSLYPIVEYEYISRNRFPRLVSPISERERYQILSSALKDFSKISNWYSVSVDTNEYASKIKEFKISIPKLKIEDALVTVGGEDLSLSLIQFPGTAEIGREGNTVVFGHSVLPVFFNPKNYMTIFSTIPKLENGDEIFVNKDKVVYKYRVVGMYEVEPDNLDILDQRIDGSVLSLVTCVPPGHPLKPRRLVVKTELIKI